ncbi:hypothetical protein HY486_04015 [Candidatus Woesearchaeota archaeon]|nr:hypothetical protein [Candidatus Woesearchaeota archaeon]
MEKINQDALVKAVTGTTGILYVICALLFYVAPAKALGWIAPVLHGIDITKIAAQNLTFSSFLIGLIEVLVISAVIAYVFAKIYNRGRK